jgi:hypothetical protein
LSVQDLETFEDSDEEISNLFAVAGQEFLHGAPVSQNMAPAPRGKAKAWVVFNGRQTGVYETW